MELEVALLEYGIEGVRLLGRCTDPDLVEKVRARLVERLSPERPSTRSPARRLRSVPDENDAVEE